MSKKINGLKKKKQGIKTPFAQFIAIIALSISIFLIVDLGRRAAANYRVQREAERLSQEVKAAKQIRQELLARRDYVTSDLYIEEAARKELKWARPGETVIVVMVTPEAVPEPPGRRNIQSSETVPIARSPAQAWWGLFFGTHQMQAVP